MKLMISGTCLIFTTRKNLTLTMGKSLELSLLIHVLYSVQTILMEIEIVGTGSKLTRNLAQRSRKLKEMSNISG